MTAHTSPSHDGVFTEPKPLSAPGIPTASREACPTTAGSDKIDEIANSFAIRVRVLAAETAEEAVLGTGNVDDEQQPSMSERTPLLGHRERRRDEEEPPVASSNEVTYLSDTDPKRFWLCNSLILINLFIASFDGTIMASSHPVITSHFDAANSATWLSTSFLLTSTTFQPLLGRLSDAVGRKPLFIICSALTLVSIVWCGMAQSIESFIAARALSGIGCGGATTLGAILTSDLVSIERRGSYQSYINMMVGAGGALGAALGGFMAEALGWRWEFGVQVPFQLFVTVLAVFAIPDGIGAQGGKSVWDALRSFDVKGSALLTTSLAFLIMGINIGGNNLPWSHPFVISALVICAVGFPIFFYSQSKALKPIMPLAPLRTSPRANLVFANFILALIYSCLIFNMPLYFQAVLLSNATNSGLRLVIPTMVSSTVGAVTGQLITRTRRLKWPVAWGCAIFTAGTFSLCLLRPGLPEFAYIAVMIPSSVGQGLFFPGSFMAILAASGQKEQAVITSTFLLWRSLGLVVGVAYGGLVVQNALVYYLHQYIDAPNKEDIISAVRRSVELVAQLEEPLRSQVASSYDAAIRLSFAICAIMAVFTVVWILPIKLPRLQGRSIKN